MIHHSNILHQINPRLICDDLEPITPITATPRNFHFLEGKHFKKIECPRPLFSVSCTHDWSNRLPCSRGSSGICRSPGIATQLATTPLRCIKYIRPLIIFITVLFYKGLSPFFNSIHFGLIQHLTFITFWQHISHTEFIYHPPESLPVSPIRVRWLQSTIFHTTFISFIFITCIWLYSSRSTLRE